jgi:hypothetical protein
VLARSLHRLAKIYTTWCGKNCQACQAYRNSGIACFLKAVRLAPRPNRLGKQQAISAPVELGEQVMSQTLISNAMMFNGQSGEAKPGNV